MRKGLIIIVGALLMLSSCGSYTATGAYTGASFGNVLGSAIGGISGGWRGEHVGSLIGTVGGAMVGAAIGSAAEKAEQKKIEDYRQRRLGAAGTQQRDYAYDDSGFDPTNSHDDRISFDTNDAVLPITIRNAHIVDTDNDGILKRGEKCTVVFEIMNNSSKPLRNVCPLVVDVTGNKHINISPNLRIESINPYQGVRYSATILADNRLKDGEITIRIGVSENNKELTSLSQDIIVPTRKK
jgi:hypothetical protein